MPAVKFAILSRGDEQLKRFSDGLSTNIADAMRAISLELHANAVDSFRKQETPYGEKWAPNSPTTLTLRAQGFHLSGPRLSKTKKKRTPKQVARFLTGARVLIDKGLLLGSLSPQATPRTATVTTNVPYARVQQLGNPDNRIPNRDGGNPAPIPPRAFLPLVKEGGGVKAVLPEALRAACVAILKAKLFGR